MLVTRVRRNDRKWRDHLRQPRPLRSYNVYIKKTMSVANRRDDRRGVRYLREYDVTIVSNVLPFGHPVPYDRVTSTLTKREHSEREGWPSRDTLATLVRLVLTSQTCLYLVTPLNTILRSKYSSWYRRSILLVLTNSTRIVYITKSSKLRARHCLSWLRAYAAVSAVTRSILYK